MAREAQRGRGKPVTVGELMLRADVHGRQRPEDLEVLELAYRMRRRIGPEPEPAVRVPSPRKRMFGIIAGLLRRRPRSGRS